MINKFYTNVYYSYGKAHYRGYMDGKPFNHSSKVMPYIFYEPSDISLYDKEDIYQTLDGKQVVKKTFDSASSAKAFLNQYKEMDGVKYYGSTNWIYPWINDFFHGKIKYDTNLIKVGYIDIEVMADGEFEKPETARKEITAITLRFRNINYVWGCREYKNSRDDVTYFRCLNEVDLLRKFLRFWKEIKLDVVTGWHNKWFDMPYITKRIEIVLGEEFLSHLCIWGKPEWRTMKVNFKEEPYVIYPGIEIIDYIDVYKKFKSATEESFKLDYISEKILGHKKLDYSEEGTLHELYLKNYQKYIDYNMLDATLVNQIDDKLKLLDIVFVIAYECKVNYSDAFGTVRKWDTLIHNYLLDKRIVVPKNEKVEFDEEYEGGYVKEPKAGKYKWVVSFDVNSLYPSLIRQCNISNETFIGKFSNVNVNTFLSLTTNTNNGGDSFDTIQSKLVTHNMGLAANGVCFKNNKQGIFSELMEEYFAMRKENQNKAKSFFKIKEGINDKNSKEYQDADNNYLRYNSLQLALKILINSFYGALANKYFRWYDVKLAEAITTTGQAVIQWVMRDVEEYLSNIVGRKIHPVIAGDTDSVTGDTIINVNGSEISIAEYYNKVADNFIKNDDFNENYVKLIKNNDTTPSINMNTGEIENNNINYIMKHKVNKKMYKITNNNGESVIVTEDHSVIVYDKIKQSFYSVKPKNLNKDVHKIINIKKLTEFSDFEIEDLGYLEEYVYDIEVENNHNFFGNGICVHNSLYLSLNELIDESTEEFKDILAKVTRIADEDINEVIKKSLNNFFTTFNHREPILKMARENIADRALWQKKKRYALNVWNKEGTEFSSPQVKISGLEAIKSSTPRLCRKGLTDAITLILQKDDDNELISFVENFKKEFNNAELDLIGLPKSGNNLIKYSDPKTLYQNKCPINTRAALVYNKFLRDNDYISKGYKEIDEGEKIKMFYLNVPNPVGENVIAIPYDYPKDMKILKYIDYNDMFVRSFITPLKMVADAVNWRIEHVDFLDDSFFEDDETSTNEIWDMFLEKVKVICQNDIQTINDFLTTQVDALNGKTPKQMFDIDVMVVLEWLEQVYEV